MQLYSLYYLSFSKASVEEGSGIIENITGMAVFTIFMEDWREDIGKRLSENSVAYLQLH